MSDNVANIIAFNRERNLFSFNKQAEYDMLHEELEEFEDATIEYELVDALNDMIVLATGALFKLGYDPNLTLAETVKEITSRKGQINLETGKWVKDKNQDPFTLYKADYSNCSLA